MKRRMVTGVLGVVAIAGFSLAVPAAGSAGVDISVSFPLPGIVIAGPPALVVIPGTQVYYVPDIEPEIFFSGGYWYRLHLGRWYIAAAYVGPWYYVAPQAVPVVVLNRPAAYRYSPRVSGQVPLAEAWQERRSWDREYDRYDRRWKDDDRGRSEYYKYKDKRFDRVESRGRGSRGDR